MNDKTKHIKANQQQTHSALKSTKELICFYSYLLVITCRTQAAMALLRALQSFSFSFLITVLIIIVLLPTEKTLRALKSRQIDNHLGVTIVSICLPS